MSLKSKAKAQRQREQLKLKQAMEDRRNADAVDRLKTLTSGFARTRRTDRQTAIYEASKMPQYAKSKPVIHTASLEERFTPKGKALPAPLSEEMQARQDLAKDKTREIMKRVDIGYNKGGLMLLSESEFEAMKRGELKRRS